MFDASKNLALKRQPSYFRVNFFDMDGLFNQYTIWCFVGKNTQLRPFMVKIRKSLHQALSE